MSECKHLKLKLDRSLECKLTGKKITWDKCKNCKLRELKLTNIKPIKKRTSKLAKAEKNRFSILTKDLSKCIICNKKREHLHEIYPGAFRQRSIKYNMVIPLCASCHTQIHKDYTLSLHWKRLCQQKFEESHTREEFIKIFRRSYL